MTSFVDRLEQELLRAGYGPARQRRRLRAAGASVAAVACVAVALVLALRTHAAPPPPAKAPDCPAAARSGADVDGRLLRALGVLRAAPARGQTDADARCAEARVPAGPVYADGARYVGPGPLGGRVYLVPVEHWSRVDGAMTPRARAWRLLPGACLVTVGGPQFDAASFCASVREIPGAGAFATAQVPQEGPLADELAARGVPDRLRRGSFVKLIVPDGVASLEARYRGGAVARARVRANTVILHVGRPAPSALHARFTYFDARHRRVRLR